MRKRLFFFIIIIFNIFVFNISVSANTQYQIGVNLGDEFVWQVTKVDANGIKEAFGFSNWKQYIRSKGGDERLNVIKKINITQIDQVSDGWTLEYNYWQWIPSDNEFLVQPTSTLKSFISIYPSRDYYPSLYFIPAPSYDFINSINTDDENIEVYSRTIIINCFTDSSKTGVKYSQRWTYTVDTGVIDKYEIKYEGSEKYDIIYEYKLISYKTLTPTITFGFNFLFFFFIGLLSITLIVNYKKSLFIENNN